MNPILVTVVQLSILIASIVLHEISHGAAALALGDSTAKDKGRLTLNPIVHMDPVGSVILPLMSVLLTSSFFGYAKPVPVNRFRLRRKEVGFALVAIAGPVTNILIAIICLLSLRWVPVPSSEFVSAQTSFGAATILVLAAEINIFLAAFNLLPIPPLDGSRIIRPFVSKKGVSVLDRIEPYGFVILLVLLVFLGDVFGRIIGFVYTGLYRAIFALLGLAGI